MMCGDFSGLVNVECKKRTCSLTKAFFRLEVVGDVNMPQAGLLRCDTETVFGGEQEPCVERSLQVS